MNTFYPELPSALPAQLESAYELVSCLKCSEQSATYLLREKESGKKYLLKTADDPSDAALLKKEKSILEFIHQTDRSWIGGSFPYPVSLEYEAGSVRYIRTYIEGNTLEELCETGYGQPGLPAAQALDYIIRLTEILQFMHSQKPPLIHRDIKPQNVIIDRDGNCHLIDLGISRFYHSMRDSDTVIMGTKLTAPPEQFGYQQTDVRSDLYSMGILLLYCITGEYEPNDSALLELPDELQQIIRHATMFDPARRYQNAGELLADLLAARYPSVSFRNSAPLQKKARLYKRAFLSLFAFNFILFTALAGHRMAVQLGSAPHNYTFREPLIEDAVRAELNIYGRPITTEELRLVTELHIFGMQQYGSEDDIWLRGGSPWVYDYDMRNAGLYEQNGSISSLEDIRHLPNLVALSLYNQNISDISALKGTKIRKLGLGWNPLTDLSPLYENQSIEYLCVADLDITSVAVIASLPKLNSLNISGTKISYLDGMEQCDLRTLNIYNTPLVDYSQLTMFPNLRDLDVHILSEDMISALSGSSLVRLIVAYTEIESLDTLSGISSLEELRLGGNSLAEMSFGQPSLSRLNNLTLEFTRIRDFHGASSLTDLTHLLIYGAECLSFDGLDEIPKLREITCTQEQKDAICAQFPDREYVFYVFS